MRGWWQKWKKRLAEELKWDSKQIREFFEAHGLSVQGWDKIRTDWLAFRKTQAKPPDAESAN